MPGAHSQPAGGIPARHSRRSLLGAAAALCLLPALPARAGGGRVLRVGPGRELAAPGAAARAARDGDTILIDAGDYPGDAAVWHAHGLTIAASGGPVRLPAAGAHAEGKAIWVIKGRDIRIEGIAFLGAAVPDGNGAGIRQQASGLLLRRCRFEHNETGLLTHNDPGTTLHLEGCVFAHNGPGPRHNHNLYAGRIAELTVLACSLHHARIGHNLKSRARLTRVLYSRIMDEADGQASYAVDVPEGGDVLLLGNLLQQGPRAENRVLLSAGSDRRRHRDARLVLAHNTLVSEGGAASFVRVHDPHTRVVRYNNLLVGAGRDYVGPRHEGAGDLRAALADLAGRAPFDYRPRAGDAAVDAARALPAEVPAPRMEYCHEASSVPRLRRGSADDVGALEAADVAEAGCGGPAAALRP